MNQSPNQKSIDGALSHLAELRGDRNMKLGLIAAAWIFAAFAPSVLYVFPDSTPSDVSVFTIRAIAVAGATIVSAIAFVRIHATRSTITAVKDWLRNAQKNATDH